MPKTVHNIFLAGHGNWFPNYGFTQVPKGCKIHFYTEFAKTLNRRMSLTIETGEYREILRTVDEYKMCPNLRLSTQQASWSKDDVEAVEQRNEPNCSVVFCETVVPNSRFVHLETIFEYVDRVYRNCRHEILIEFHWIACLTAQASSGSYNRAALIIGRNVDDFGLSKFADKGRYMTNNLSTVLGVSNGRKFKYKWTTINAPRLYLRY